MVRKDCFLDPNRHVAPYSVRWFMYGAANSEKIERIRMHKGVIFVAVLASILDGPHHIMQIRHYGGHLLRIVPDERLIFKLIESRDVRNEREAIDVAQVTFLRPHVGGEESQRMVVCRHRGRGLFLFGPVVYGFFSSRCGIQCGEIFL